jgi:hypothetical protein
MNKKTTEKLEWTIHTPNLLKEIAQNPDCAILSTPLNLFRRILGRVADRAIELNDDLLNALMIRLTLYSVADPDSPDYDRAIVEKYRKISKEASGIAEENQ